MPASSAGRANAPPDRACWAIAISCGLATTSATATASPATASPAAATLPAATLARRPLHGSPGRAPVSVGTEGSVPTGDGASQPVATAAISTAPAIAPASSAVSWLISTETPSTTPSSTASRRRPAAPQPDRRAQRRGHSEHPGRDVQMEPDLPVEHGGQAVQRPGRDRAGPAQPQPRRQVHHVAEQARQDDRDQPERRGRPGGQRDRREQDAKERHRGVVAQLDADRGGHRPGEPRVGQVDRLVRDPPQGPDVAADVPHRRHPARPGGHPRPGHRDPGGQVGGQHGQLPGRGPAAPPHTGLRRALPAAAAPREAAPAGVPPGHAMICPVLPMAC